MKANKKFLTIVLAMASVWTFLCVNGCKKSTPSAQAKSIELCTHCGQIKGTALCCKPVKEVGWGFLGTTDGKTVSVRPMGGWGTNPPTFNKIYNRKIIGHISNFCFFSLSPRRLHQLIFLLPKTKNILRF